MTAKPTLLYVDDDGALARLVQRGLTRHGFSVEHVPNGEAGLARITQGGIDVIALDQHMPGLDGLETLERIQAIPGAPPVVSEKEAMGDAANKKPDPPFLARVGLRTAPPTALATFVTRPQAGSNRREGPF